MSGEHKLLLNTPGKNFNEYFPIGNGRLGGMISGGMRSEKIPLNDDTLWAGAKAPEPRPEASMYLPEVRKLLSEGVYDKAQELVEKYFTTDFNQPYLSAGNLNVEYSTEIAKVTDYSRVLDLQEASVRVEYKEESEGKDSFIKRQYFVSQPDDVMMVVIGSDHELHAVFSLDSQLRSGIFMEQDCLFLDGEVPLDIQWPGVDWRIKPGEGIRYDGESPCKFCIGIKVDTNGTLNASTEALSVTGATSIVVYLSIVTSRKELDPRQVVWSNIIQASSQPVADIWTRHIHDYQRLYQKIELSIDRGEQQSCNNLPVDRRLHQKGSKGFQDVGLEELLFNYGRYLLISSSRRGTEPANLMGIWNDSLQPPWWSNYTLNINTQMNYWLAEPCGLGECHEPLLEMVKQLSIAGEETARVHYGCRGWVAHHQTDYHRQTTPVGRLKGISNPGCSQYAMWPMGGAWLCLHLWNHYQYHLDKQFLADAWSIIRGAALFLCDWLIKSENGLYTTAPSTSPENRYIHTDGYSNCVCQGSAMDLSITRELFTVCCYIDEILDLENDLVINEIKERLPHLQTLTISSRTGCVQEWGLDDFKDAEHPHRHLSQLFGLYPGNEISVEKTKDLAEAARKTLEFRGDTGTGWSLVWKIILWAQLGDAERAHRLMQNLFVPVDSKVFEVANDGGGLYPNLLAACPPMMLEANYGFTAAVIEMLVQVRDDQIILLPALPKAWKRGYIKNLSLPGQMKLTLSWDGGELKSYQLCNPLQKEVEVLYQGSLEQIV